MYCDTKFCHLDSCQCICPSDDNGRGLHDTHRNCLLQTTAGIAWSSPYGATAKPDILDALAVTVYTDTLLVEFVETSK